jgi:polyisoprenoid-binding protein YceI
MRYTRCVQVMLAVLASVCVAGIACGADTYLTDPSHTSVSFSVRHLAIYKVRGKFKEFSGTIMYDENDITQSSMHGTIKAASIDTDNEKRDKELRSEKFLDAATFPDITFVSKRVEQKDGAYALIGDLTLRGVTKEIALPFTITGHLVHYGKTLLGFEASIQINRREFGITYAKVTDMGGLIVGNTVYIELIGRAIKQENSSTSGKAGGLR